MDSGSRAGFDELVGVKESEAPASFDNGKLKHSSPASLSYKTATMDRTITCKSFERTMMLVLCSMSIVSITAIVFMVLNNGLVTQLHYEGVIISECNTCSQIEARTIKDFSYLLLSLLILRERENRLLF